MNTLMRLKEEQERIAALIEEEQKKFNPEDLKEYGVGLQCIIRTYAAGVFFGTVVAREGQDVVLRDARRIWSWEGAFTLSAVAVYGIKKGKLSCVEPEKLVLQVIEISPCSDSAAKQLTEWPTHDPN